MTATGRLTTSLAGIEFLGAAIVEDLVALLQQDQVTFICCQLLALQPGQRRQKIRLDTKQGVVAPTPLRTG